MKRFLIVLVSIVLLTSCYIHDGQEDVSDPIPVGPSVKGDNLAMGNPSNASANVVNADNYLMVKDQYVLSYNDSKHTANWVSWHLSTAWIGPVDRQDNFRSDVTLPSSWVAVKEYSYSGSGFDRGHICPSADRTTSISYNSATFLMTNMMPQAPENNQKPWADFENYCRYLAKKGYELYIVAGPAGVGGAGRYGYKEKIGDEGVVVPKYTWKVVIALLNGENDVARVDAKTRTIAIWIPNDQTASSKSWYNYRVSIDDIESQTGFDFFSNLPDEVEKVIEAKVDNTPI
ncbi:DNA/RNA non-specific endonuclease [uncultured Acetobacteroides sp.]|uniref:DNA/RNA non-specific endonuclease n=1 Tax=uncultured Acetobacteroides sp. TaxID=1760811 RepID=UPI0029F4D3C8|nr:DNA/RNA non-specific endonuclease [uncultured Acetobacteroides sp.]